MGLDMKTKKKLSEETAKRKPEIPKHSICGILTTGPAKNLNKLIPIRTFFDSCGGFKSLMKGLESDCNHLMRTPYLAVPQ